MVKVTIEDFIESTGSIYKSTVLAFKRAKQLSEESRTPTIDVKEGEKITTIAIKEVILKTVIPCESKEMPLEY